MRAAVLFGPGDLRVETLPVPSIKSDEILVKVKSCGICGSDLHLYKTGALAVYQRPSILGHEYSGEVVEVGADITGLSVGDRVLGASYLNCGRCEWCRRGQISKCTDFILPGYGLDGGFAEYVVVPRPPAERGPWLGNTFFKIPEAIDWDIATTVEPVAVACCAVGHSGLQRGQTVLVLGAGMIGQCIAQVCKTKGAGKIIVSETAPKRLAMAEKMGADAAVNPAQTNLVEAIKQITSEAMVDLAFECSGAPVALRQALQSVRADGTVMQIALFERNVEFDAEMMKLLRRNRISLRGCGGDDWPEAVELVRLGKVKTQDLITHRFSLADAREAFEVQLDAGKSIKVLIKP